MRHIFTYLLIICTILVTGCSEDTLGEEIKGAVSGKVISKATNEPLENVKISTSPASSTVFSDEAGEFLLEGVLIGDYSVKAEMEGYSTAFEAVNVTAETTSTVAFELSKSGANNKKPLTPILGSPEDNATQVDVPVQFTWSSSDPDNDELTYELQLRNSINEEVLTFSEITDTTYTVENLNWGSKYFWQVKVSDEVNDPVLSPLKSFTTSNMPNNRILFTRTINGNSVIFARDPEGEEYRLTSETYNSFRPRKNNSSNKIAFLRTVGAETHLFTMDPDGSNQKQVTSAIPVNAFKMAQVDFDWADDGSALVYPNYRNLFKINATGGGLKLIYQTSNGDFISEVAVGENEQTIALITNNSNGYDADLFTINFEGQVQEQILNNVTGAIGGLDLSVTGNLLLYTHDVSGYENDSYRRLNSQLFVYNLSTGQTTNYSIEKEDGTNDLDPKFSPNEASIIFENTSNDGISQKDILTLRMEDYLDNIDRRELIIENATMPDWE